jgi:hypothetical protein
MDIMQILLGGVVGGIIGYLWHNVPALKNRIGEIERRLNEQPMKGWDDETAAAVTKELNPYA